MCSCICNTPSPPNPQMVMHCSAIHMLRAKRPRTDEGEPHQPLRSSYCHTMVFACASCMRTTDHAKNVHSGLLVSADNCTEHAMDDMLSRYKHEDHCAAFYSLGQKNHTRSMGSLPCFKHYAHGMAFGERESNPIQQNNKSAEFLRFGIWECMWTTWHTPAQLTTRVDVHLEHFGKKHAKPGCRLCWDFAIPAGFQITIPCDWRGA